MSLWRSTLHGTQNGQTIDVIHSWRDTRTPSVADANVLANSVFVAWGVHMMPKLHDSYVVTQCDVFAVDDPTTAGVKTGSVAGGLDNDGPLEHNPLPPFICARVKYTTDLRGRSFRGRGGIPALVEGYADNTNPNYLTTTAQSSLQAGIDSFFSAVAGGVGWSLGQAVISEVSNGVPRPAPIATGVQARSVSLALGTRNSRKA